MASYTRRLPASLRNSLILPASYAYDGRVLNLRTLKRDISTGRSKPSNYRTNDRWEPELVRYLVRSDTCRKVSICNYAVCFGDEVIAKRLAKWLWDPYSGSDTEYIYLIFQSCLYSRHYHVAAILLKETNLRCQGVFRFVAGYGNGDCIRAISTEILAGDVPMMMLRCAIEAKNTETFIAIVEHWNLNKDRIGNIISQLCEGGQPPSAEIRHAWRIYVRSCK